PTPVAERKPGVPMPIVASLTDTGPIKGANVIAAVQRPSGSVVNLKLYDDGAHGDGAKDDGIYANTFLQTGQGGSYNVNVTATGTSPLSGSFTRQDVASFHLGSTSDPNGIKDSDGDGLPDDWEIRFGTNPNVNDATADPDNDGWSNSQEWQRGTDPHNSDTDGGGEADSTDPNPLDPSDDRIQPTWAIAYPGVSKVFIRYALRPQYAVVGIFRGTNPNGPFTIVGINNPATGVFTDTAVVNGTTYCYIALAIDTLGRRSAGLAPSCATPKADPLAPHGWVQINGGAPRTGTPNVRLTLGASDTIDPESEQPGDPVPPPPDDSATGVKEMLISNQPDFAGATWQPYAPTKTWTLGQLSGLAAVYVKYRDFAGNESDMAVATIHVQPVFLPIVRR
ncbi:MAG: choice-of-anchor X domain-containing protein, partial [Roseiflexaceae bacterium]